MPFIFGELYKIMQRFPGLEKQRENTEGSTAVLEGNQKFLFITTTTGDNATPFRDNALACWFTIYRPWKYRKLNGLPTRISRMADGCGNHYTTKVQYNVGKN